MRRCATIFGIISIRKAGLADTEIPIPFRSLEASEGGPTRVSYQGVSFIYRRRVVAPEILADILHERDSSAVHILSRWFCDYSEIGCGRRISFSCDWNGVKLMTSIRGPEEVPPPASTKTEAPDGEETKLGHPFSFALGRPHPLFHLVERIAKRLPDPIKRRFKFLLSFKNRILMSTFFVFVGVVVVVGIMLQVAVFPLLKGDSAAITHLKIIHFVASLTGIAVGWLFIEFISKMIARPLIELTAVADHISREAGQRIAARSFGPGIVVAEQPDDENNSSDAKDEIRQLTLSFNRMLRHLKASETSLRESEEKYRFLFDNGPSPIFVIDAGDLRILDVNARSEEEYNYSREEFLNMSFADLGLDRDRMETRNRLKQIFPTEVTLLPILQHVRKDGSVFMVSFQARLSRYRNRPAIIAAVWDVTERLEKQAQLIQAGKMATLGEMATGIAHELNQPLNVIMLGCDYLLKKMRSRQPVTVDDLTQVTGELTSSVERAARIINHLRQFGRLADEAMVPINVNEPISSVFTLLGKQLEARGIQWELELSGELPKIMGDPNRLEQVFMNLILNARDAMLDMEGQTGEKDAAVAKTVTIRSYRKDSRVVVTVSDTGPGISSAIRPKVFEPFFTTKKTGEGTGLGLSISYGIVKEHNGTIEIEDKAEHGTTFRLSFPAISHGDHV
jgi:PAS domain S-box-containing protein